MSGPKRPAWGSADSGRGRPGPEVTSEEDDGIDARLARIVHRAGCMGPTTIAAMPFATSLGRNPYIVIVADGKGGELLRCRLCGMVEGQDVAAEPAADGMAAPDAAGFPTMAAVLAARAELEAAGLPAGARTIARKLGCSESTVRRRLGRRN